MAAHNASLNTTTDQENKVYQFYGIFSTHSAAWKAIQLNWTPKRLRTRLCATRPSSEYYTEASYEIPGLYSLQKKFLLVAIFVCWEYSKYM